MPNALTNGILTDTRYSAAFANDGPTGAIHVPSGWSYLYEADGSRHVIERRDSDEQPGWIVHRPPQAQPARPHENGTYLETSSYSGIGGFRQRVTIRGHQRYVARALFTLFVMADEPPENAVRVQTRITHGVGVVRSGWYAITAEGVRRPIETLTPMIESSASGDILFDFIADIRAPLSGVRLVIHELALNTVPQDYGTPTRIVPLGTIPPPPATPTSLPPVPRLAVPPVDKSARQGCRPSLRSLRLVLPERRQTPPTPPSSGDDWPL